MYELYSLMERSVTSSSFGRGRNPTLQLDEDGVAVGCALIMQAEMQLKDAFDLLFKQVILDFTGGKLN